MEPLQNRKKMTLSPYFVLDATLRDGGYLNQWNFSKEEVLLLVKSLLKTGVEAIEVGYIDDSKKLPLAAQCDVSLLRELQELVTGQNCAIVAMISLQKTNPEQLLKSRKDYLDLVRIPAAYDQIDEALEVASIANKLGIKTSINLVNISVLSDLQIQETVQKISEATAVDFLYLADSRGACKPSEVKKIVATVRESWSGVLGFHAHNNLGLAAANSLMALDSGCNAIDGTIDGLGLGLGNLNLAHALKLIEPYQEQRVGYDYNTLTKLQGVLSIKLSAELSYMYYLVGLKNMAQLWVEPLLKKYGTLCHQYLSHIPEKPYLQIEEVFSEMERQLQFKQNTTIKI
jgi:4-hydroxy 2-oxovalerate aldolase